ncbi:MAG: hypothetical protein ACMUHM_09070 [Thermoplasmatota archaeon]
MVDLKKFMMKHVWRLQQIGALYSVTMLTITITLVLYPYVEWRFIRLFDSLGIPTSWDLLIMMIIFTSILSFALIFGFAYDKVLKLWVSQTVVAVERNPYAKNMMTPKEWLNWQYYFIPMLKVNGKDKEAEFMEKWNLKVLKEDPILRRDVEEVINWVKDFELPAGKELKGTPGIPREL